VKISASFPSWYITDGNYSPLRNGELVNLSFELVPERITCVSASEPEHMVQIGGAEYQFCAKVLKIYSADRPLAVVEAEGFRFYIYQLPEKTEHFEEGDKIWGIGILSLDHYLWVKFLHQYVDAPDLFYKLRITGICELPEQKQVESMAHSEAFDWLVNFGSDGVNAEAIPKTFNSRPTKDRET
jgi:hypothetical protein